LEHARLQQMVDYAEADDCLRATILRYFGDPAVRERCGSCGNCQTPGGLTPDDRAVLCTVLDGIVQARERYGRRRIAAMLTGDTSELPDGLRRLSALGSLRHEGHRTIDGWISAAIGAGLIAVSKDQYRTLSLSALGRDVMSGRAEVPSMTAPLRLSAHGPGRFGMGRRVAYLRSGHFSDW
jgi:ATP-dependent DNA helicase RecQ